MKFKTSSPEETLNLGYEIGKSLKGGEVIMLYGPLGSGKTVFIKGLAQGLEIEPNLVTSPSFTFIHIYLGKFVLYHIDLYRVEKVEGELLYEILNILEEDSTRIVVVEWAEKLNSLNSERLKKISKISVKLDFLSDSERLIILEC